MTKAKGPANRTRLSRERREREIVAAARKIFEARGYEDATIAEIADAVGVVEGTVLHYFRSKRALMARVIEGFYEEVIDIIENGASGISGAENKLRYVIHSHLTFLTENARLCTVIISESRNTQHDLLDKVRDYNRHYTNIVVNIVREGKRCGDIHEKVSPALVRNVVFGTIEHYLWDMMSGHPLESAQEVGEQLTRLIFNGIVESNESTKSEVNKLILKLNTLIS